MSIRKDVPISKHKTIYSVSTALWASFNKNTSKHKKATNSQETEQYIKPNSDMKQML